MRISIDLDGVLCDFEGACQRVARELFPMRKLGRLPGQHMIDKLGFEWNAVWQRIIATPNFYESLAPIEPNVTQLRDWLRRQQTRDHEVMFLTSRAPTAGNCVSKQSEHWLARQNILAYSMVPVSLHIVERASKKRDRIVALGLDASIDDFYQTVEQCTSDSHYAFLMDTGRDRGTVPSERVVVDISGFLRAIGVD